VILTGHSYVTVYIYPRYSHLKSLASYFGLQVSRTHPHVYYSFLLRTSAIQSLTQTSCWHNAELVNKDIHCRHHLLFLQEKGPHYTQWCCSKSQKPHWRGKRRLRVPKRQKERRQQLSQNSLVRQVLSMMLIPMKSDELPSHKEPPKENVEIEMPVVC